MLLRFTTDLLTIVLTGPVGSCLFAETDLLFNIIPPRRQVKQEHDSTRIPIYLIEMSMGYSIKLGTPFYLTLAYVVLLPGLASFFFWIKGISIIGANRAGIFLHLMPIFGAVMAMIIFDEKFMFYHFLGAIFILSGILLSNKKKI